LPASAYPPKADTGPVSSPRTPEVALGRPYRPARVVPPKGAPNILLVMTDDIGFGVTSTFGGVVPTPTLDKIAANGLRYLQFDGAVFAITRGYHYRP